MATDNFNYGTPLKGVNRKEGLDRELKSKGYNTSYMKPEGTSFAQEINRQNVEEPAVQNIGFAGVNDSSYDAEITSASQLDNISNTRGELQPWYAQIGAGLAKAGVLAGTTLADGIIGTVVGVGNAAATGTFSGFWDNPFSNAMQNINEWSEKALPNYYTDAELSQPWYDNIFTSNFIGDKFLKNLGFAVGAYYSGKPVAAAASKLLGFDKARKAFKGAVTASGEALDPKAAIQAYKKGDAFLDGVQLTEDLAKSAKKLKMASPTLKLTGSFAGALGESRIEAINNSKDWHSLHLQQLDDAKARIEESERAALMNESPEYSTIALDENGNFTEKLTEQGQAMLDERVKSKFDYEGGVRKLSEDRLKMGNVDFLLNLPLLTLSDAWQFGKLYAGGFNTAKRASNITRKIAENGGISYEALKPSKLRMAGKILSKGIAEGPVEEMGQAVAGKTAGYKYASELNNFYGAKIDPDAEEETIDWMKSMGKAITETYGTTAGWEEGFIGGLTGMLGIPGFRGVKNSEGKLQSPVYLQGGMRDDIKEINEQNERTEAVVSQMNNRVQSPEFLNYYQSTIRHNKYQKDMDEAVDNNDNFEFKNAEHNQLINDVVMFDKAGRIQDLYDVIEEAGTVKPEDVEQIRQLTANQESGKSIYDSLTDEEVISKIKTDADNMKSEVDNYRKISSDLQAKLGDVFSEDGLEEMTYMFSNIDNIENRFKSLHQSIKDRLIEMEAVIPDEEFISEGTDKKLKISDLLSMNPVKLLQSLSKSTNAQAFISALDNSLPKTQEKSEILNDIIDLGKMAEKRAEFIDNYSGYIHNPKSLQDKINKQADTVSTAKVTEEKDKLKNSLLQVNNLPDFRKALGQEPNADIKNELLAELETEGNQLAKDYKEVQQYNSSVANKIDLMQGSPQAKSDALSILQDQFNNSNNLLEMANINSAHVDNAGALYDTELTDDENIKKFSEAQALLVSAMIEANKDNKFKGRFSGEYTNPSNKGVPNPLAPSKDSTGDSGTTTIPPVSGPSTNIYSPPVGNITDSMLDEENKKGNLNETPSSFDNKNPGVRQYYKPTIPELHIQGAIDGDFRPYDVVVKEKEGADYSVFYNYLRDNGAFSYVNEGNLKPGDELGFMIDPSLEDQMSVYPWYKGPSIFIIDKRNNQIVGSLDSKKSIVDKYEGLQQLIDKVKEEFTKSNSKDKFIATPITKVSQVMIGKIPYGQESKSLSEISNVDPKTAVFGIIKNGTLNTNGKLTDTQVIKPVDMSNKEGRMYLLIPNAQGKYSPASVRVKHFNKEEFDPSNIEVASTKVAANIKSGINALASVTSDLDLKAAVGQLARDLYIGDLHIDYISSEAGTGIRFTKVFRDAQGKEILTGALTKEGKAIRKEDSRVVLISEGEGIVELTIHGDNNMVVGGEETKSTDDIAKEITDVLLDFNLPIQVNIGTLNTTGYNQLLVGSDILTSNISDARVLSSWFTTDYFDANGKLQSATNPVSQTPEQRRNLKTPVGGQEGVVAGIPISISTLEEGKVLKVDLQTNRIYDENGKLHSTSNDQLYFDLAYVQSNFGNSQSSSTMVEGKCILPSGKVLNRNTNNYLSEAEATEVKNKIANRGNIKTNVDKVVDQITESQSKVNKSMTDNDFYYIEENGEYVPYDRVHKRLGDNWIQSVKQAEALKAIQLKLSQLANTKDKYNEYLKYLSEHYHVNLDSYVNEVGFNARNRVVNAIRDAMNSTNSQRALDAGSAVDSIIRNFFTSTETPVKPSNMTESAFIDLLTSLNIIKSNIELRGEKFLTNNIVLYHKYPDGTRVAGEVDILSVDTDGNFRIYDVKTSRYSFYDFVDRRGATTNYFSNKSNTQRMSSKDYYAQQLSAYKNLFESQHKVPIVQLAILPFVLNYDKNTVSSITKEKGILVEYNPNVNVPLDIPVAKTIDKVVPIFNSSIETMSPINELTDTNIEGSKVGYYVTDGKVKTNHLLPIGDIAGHKAYLAPTPNYSTGFGNEAPHVASYDYYVVFENGNSAKVSKNVVVNKPINEVIDTIKTAVGKNPQRVAEMASASTLISTSVVVEPIAKEEITATNVNKPVSDLPSSQSAQQVLDRLAPQGKRKRPGKLREVTSEQPIWNKEKELEWLNKVLPQLDANELVKIQEGLIKVAESGALAWGQFDNGVITLSDIAAEGTIYHEAFHAVFNLLTEQSLRDELLQEYANSIPIEEKSYIKPWRDGKGQNKAKMFSIKGKEGGFELVKDNEEGYYSVHFKVEKDSLSGLEKELLFQKLADAIPIGGKVSTWGEVSKGGFSGVRRFTEIGFKPSDETRQLGVKKTSNINDISSRYGYPIEGNKVITPVLVKTSNILGERLKVYLEEEMAEGFREYVMTKDSEGLGTKITNFFKSLLAKVTNWNQLRPSLNSYYKAINEGKYSDSSFIVQSLVQSKTSISTNFSSIDSQVRDNLTKRGWTEAKFNSVSQEERDQAVICAGL